MRESSPFGKFQKAVNEAIRVLQIGLGLGRCNAYVQELISLSLVLKCLPSRATHQCLEDLESYLMCFTSSVSRSSSPSRVISETSGKS